MLDEGKRFLRLLLPAGFLLHQLRGVGASGAPAAGHAPASSVRRSVSSRPRGVHRYRCLPRPWPSVRPSSCRLAAGLISAHLGPSLGSSPTVWSCRLCNSLCPQLRWGCRWRRRARPPPRARPRSTQRWVRQSENRPDEAGVCQTTQLTSASRTWGTRPPCVETCGTRCARRCHVGRACAVSAGHFTIPWTAHARSWPPGGLMSMFTRTRSLATRDPTPRYPTTSHTLPCDP